MNCSLVFKFTEHDRGAEYYCTHGAPKRPPCCSVAMGEFKQTGKTVEAQIANEDRAFERWDKWAKDREVNPWGCCNAHKAAARHIKNHKDLKALFGCITSDSTETHSVQLSLDIPAAVAKRMRKARAKRKAK